MTRKSWPATAKSMYGSPAEAMNQADLAAAEVERDALAKDVARLRKGLQFYAEGMHFDGSEWDDVSGEPPNWLCNPYGDTVEDGSIAKMALAGVDLAETGDLFDKRPA